MFDYESDIYKKKSKTSKEDFFAYIEMCDVCGLSYNCQFISRIKYTNSSGTTYTIRKCPYCDVNKLISTL